MWSLKSSCLVLASVFLIALHLPAQSTASLGSAENSGDQNARIHRIEANAVDMSIGENKPPLRLDLQRLMELYKAPGLSVAVIANFQIIWAKAYGVIEAGSTTPLTTRTLFQAGSISKPVAASAALCLVEDGKLSLDDDVNEKLRTWKVSEN